MKRVYSLALFFFLSSPLSYTAAAHRNAFPESTLFELLSLGVAKFEYRPSEWEYHFAMLVKLEFTECYGRFHATHEVESDFLLELQAVIGRVREKIAQQAATLNPRMMQLLYERYLQTIQLLKAWESSVGEAWSEYSSRMAKQVDRDLARIHEKLARDASELRVAYGLALPAVSMKPSSGAKRALPRS